MYSNKSVMIEQISVAIHKKWLHRESEVPGEGFTRDFMNALGEYNSRNRRKRESNMTLGKEMALRIDALEEQNDQLLYFINFLMEHLPDLVLRILEDELQELKQVASSSVAENGGIMQRDLLAAYFDQAGEPCPTRREKDVLDLLVKGYCAKEIAKKLFISEATVVTHKKNLKEKFCAKNTVELISKAHNHVTAKNE